MLVLEEGVDPTLARAGEGGAAARPGPACRRCLFGPPDPVATREFLEQELRVVYERQRHRWNFDFEREQPLPGRYQWERVHGERLERRPGQTTEDEVQSRLSPAPGYQTRSKDVTSPVPDPRTRTENVTSPGTDLGTRPEDPQISPEDRQTFPEDSQAWSEDITSSAGAAASPDRPLRQQMITDCLRTRRRRSEPPETTPLGDAPRAKRRAAGDALAPKRRAAGDAPAPRRHVADVSEPADGPSLAKEPRDC